MGASQTRAMSRKVRLGLVRIHPSRSPQRLGGHAALVRRVCALLLGWTLCTLAPRAAHADDVLEIPPECGSASELTREIDALRASTTHLRGGGVHPQVQLTRDGDGFVLRVALPEGARTLRDADCRALFRAAIVISALGHESSAQAVLAEEQRASAEPAPTPTRTSTAESLSPPPRQDRKAPLDGEASDARASSVQRAPSRPPRLRIRAARGPRPPPSAHAFVQAELAYGVVPALSAALQAGASFQRGLWGVRLSLGYLTPRTQERDGRGVRIQALDAGLSLELVPLRWLYLGLGVDLFVLRGRGVSVRNPRADWVAQQAPHVSLRAVFWQRGSFGLALCARALWSPKPSAFRLNEGGTLYMAERFGFQAGLAGSFQFL
jgi:hypothetical protein